MSKEKKLRSQIREYVQSIIKEDNFISRYLRNMAKRIEDREFDRIMSKSPMVRKNMQDIISKATEKTEKEITQKRKDMIKRLVKLGKADPKDPKIAKYLK
tara:strand:+ start:139 stop:438 length:300 start_codon:yes stop_codon:yes gene_type:complete